MSKNVGVWIDRKHALVVHAADGSKSVVRFDAGVDEVFPATAQSRAEHRYTKNDFVAEKTLERKSAMDRVKMYDRVLGEVDMSEAVWILGPGEAKEEFAKYLRDKCSASISIEVATADRMTDPQLVAKVHGHFAIQKK